MMSSFTYNGTYNFNSDIPIDIQHLIIHEHVDHLPNRFCEMRHQLLQIEFPPRLILIGNEAFGSCTALTQAALPIHLISIGQSAFCHCISLMKVSLPEGLQRIGIQAFAYCTALKRIQVPSTVETIERSAFLHCQTLREVKLLEGLINIGVSAFYGCLSLREIMLPDTLETIGVSAFEFCTALSRIKVPSAVNTIGGHAFSGCVNLVSMEFSPSRQEPLRIDNHAFDRCQLLINFALPSETELSVNVHETTMPQIDMECGFVDTSRVFFDRFHGDQIHEKCYHSCDTTLNELRQELEDGYQHTNASGYEGLELQFPWLIPSTEKGEIQQGSNQPVRRRDVASLDVQIFQDFKGFEVVPSGLEIIPLPVLHGDDLISHGFAFPFRNRQGKPTHVLYLSDISKMIPETLEYIQTKLPPTDILIVDALLLKGSNPVHFTLQQAMALTKQIQPRGQTYLVGMSCDAFPPHDETNAYLKKTYGSVQLANDGLVIDTDGMI